MNRIILPILFTLFILTGCTSIKTYGIENEMPDKGKPLLISVETHLPSGDLYSTESFEYDKTGNIIKYTKNVRKVEFGFDFDTYIIYEYNENNYIRYNYTKKDDILNGYTKYSLMDDGRIKSIQIFMPSGGLVGTILNTYDTEKRIIKVEAFKGNSNENERERIYKYSENNYLVFFYEKDRLVSLTETNMLSNGKIETINEYNSDNELIFVTKYEYLTEGKVDKEYYLNIKNPAYSTYMIYEYIDNDIIQYFYNSDGSLNLIKKNIYKIIN